MPMPKAKMTKIILDELAAVPAGAQEAQGTAVLKRKPEDKPKEPVSVEKQSAMTSAVQGHQHLIWMIDESQSGTTSYESSYVEGQTSGCYTGHCHPWIRNADGSITIGESLGHSHDLGTLSASLAKAQTDDKAPAIAGAANKSTQAAAVPHGGLTPEGTMSQAPDLAKQLADIQKSVTLIRKLSATEHALWKSLPDDEAETFLAKSVNDRAPMIAEFEKSNEVEYTADDGTVYRKSQAPMAKLHKMADDERRLRIDAEVAKRASDIFGNIAGTDVARTDLLKAIEREPDGTKREAMLGVVKSAAAASKDAAVAKGVNPGADPQSVSKRAELKTAVEEFAKANGGIQYEAALVKAIKTDAKIRDLYEQVRNEN